MADFITEIVMAVFPVEAQELLPADHVYGGRVRSKRAVAHVRGFSRCSKGGNC